MFRLVEGVSFEGFFMWVIVLNECIDSMFSFFILGKVLFYDLD